MKFHRSTSWLIAAALGLAAIAHADSTTATKGKDTTAAKTEAKPPKVDPAAIRALKEMGEFLQKQASFTVRTHTETDFVLDDGEKVKIGSQGDLRVRRPDHLRAHVTSDRKEREFFFDGKTFTMYGPQLDMYSKVPAPPTLRELADELTDKYGLQLPLVDLFRWGSEDYDTSEITSAMYVGPAKIDGVATKQYAFRQPGVDWQVWIDDGAKPLPRKVVLTTTDDKSRPEYSVDMKWDLGVKHADDEFTFSPPKDSKQIALAEVGALPAEASRSARVRQPKPPGE